MKSMEILSQGRVGTFKGWYRPCFLLMGLLVQQKMHPLIYHATSSYILGQYTYLCKLKIVFPAPECHVTLEV
jgi:hypothetical protein